MFTHQNPHFYCCLSSKRRALGITLVLPILSPAAIPQAASEYLLEQGAIQLLHSQTRHHHSWMYHQPRNVPWLCRTALVPKAGLCKSLLRSVWDGTTWESQLKPFRDMNILLIADQSDSNMEQVGRYYHSTARHIASGRCQVPANRLPSVIQFSQMKEDGALGAVPSTSIHSPLVITSSKL